jgi:hypothetical protein
MTEALAAAVEAAYRTFARYRIGRRLAVCTCNVCVSEENERALATLPLRQIPAGLLAEYTNSAHETPPGSQEADEFRYFLPRYFEVMALGEAPCNMGFDICLRRLKQSRFREAWRADEVAAIDAFFDAFAAMRFADLRLTCWRRPADGTMRYELLAESQDTLTCLITAGCDLPRVLAVWDGVPDPAAAVHMAEIRGRLLWKDRRLRFHSAYLEKDYEPEAEAVADFLMRPEAIDRIEAAYLVAGHEGLEQILEKGIW